MCISSLSGNNYKVNGPQIDSVDWKINWMMVELIVMVESMSTLTDYIEQSDNKILS